VALAKRLVLASGNPGKLREFRQMLEPLGVEIVAQSVLGISDAAEPHCTFVENALAKARHVAAASGLPAFADDSGICVDALDGAPGVHSARYAADAPAGTREEQDERNNRKLIAALAGKAERRAHYYCVIVLVRHAADPAPLIAEGRWQGEVITAPRGTNGFGYDPYFLPAGLDRTAAELPPDEKNAISHRGRALAQLVALMGAQGMAGEA
jgi:XTP/dITP diphosphohydrolase